jgi:hypothetical protein
MDDREEQKEESALTAATAAAAEAASVVATDIRTERRFRPPRSAHGRGGMRATPPASTRTAAGAAATRRFMAGS